MNLKLFGIFFFGFKIYHKKMMEFSKNWVLLKKMFVLSTKYSEISKKFTLKNIQNFKKDEKQVAMMICC